MKRSSIVFGILFCCYFFQAKGQGLFLEDQAQIYIQEGADLRVGGDLENNGFIENVGTVTIYGDFFNRNIFNGTLGGLSFYGDNDQEFSSHPLDLQRLSINSNGDITFKTGLINILGEIEFMNGILRADENSQLVIKSTAAVLGGNDLSYYDGQLTQLGTGFKYYPIGNNGLFTPLTMEEIIGIGVSLRVSSQVPNDEPVPIPSEEVIGVSEHANWKIELLEGSIDSILLSINFNEADLREFTNRNSINADITSPVIVKKDSINGVYQTLGVSELIDTDSVTYGDITAEKYLKLTTENAKYAAIALAPRIPNEGSLYIPNAFSPNAIEEENKNFRIYGVRILSENFELKIFNRNNVLVYTTSDYLEANTKGWDGLNRNNGNEEPSGLYYYQITYQLEGGEVKNEQNGIYLIR